MVYDEYVPEVTDCRISVIKCERGGRGTIVSEKFCSMDDPIEEELEMIKHARGLAAKETDENVTVYSVSVEEIKDVGNAVWGGSDYYSEKVISTYNAYCG